MNDNFIYPEYTVNDLVFQAALFNSNDYEGCEYGIDWERIRKENTSIPKDAESIFQKKLKKKKMMRWTEVEIETLKKLSQLNGHEKTKQIRKCFPNRSVKSCVMKMKRLNE